MFRGTHEMEEIEVHVDPTGIEDQLATSIEEAASL
jgi:hypothetical protein